MFPLRSAAVLLALSCVAVLAASSSADAQETTACGAAPEGYNVIESDDAFITGTSGPDFICAGDAANRIDGLAGPDIIHGGDGRNVIHGSAGADVIHGGPAQDRIFGGGGDDTIHGDRARDVLRGGAGNDTISGGPGRDRIFGQGGDDTLRGNAGRDILSGGDEQFTDRADGGTSTDTCIDTLRVRRCEKIKGLVSVLRGFAGEPKFELDQFRSISTSDDGMHVVVPAVAIDAPDHSGHDIVYHNVHSGKSTKINIAPAGVDLGNVPLISGDASTATFAVVDGELNTYRTHVWSRLTNETVELPLPPGELERSFAYPVAISRDGRFIFTVVRDFGGNDGQGATGRRLYRQTTDGTAELVPSNDVSPLVVLAEQNVSADGETIVTSAFGSTSPNDANGDLTNPVLHSFTGGSSDVLFESDAPGDEGVYPIGLSSDGTVVALEFQQDRAVTQIAFHNLDTEVTNVVDARDLCERCTIREGVGAQGHWSGTWAVFEAEWTRETPRHGIVLVHPDGRSAYLDPVLHEIDFAAVTPDGNTIALLPGNILNRTAMLMFR